MRPSPGAGGIFHPRILLDASSPFEKGKIKMQWMPIFFLVMQSFPFAGLVAGTVYWKGNRSLVPVLTRQTLCMCLGRDPTPRG